jgi:hypothetical protein
MDIHSFLGDCQREIFLPNFKFQATLFESIDDILWQFLKIFQQPICLTGRFLLLELFCLNIMICGKKNQSNKGRYRCRCRYESKFVSRLHLQSPTQKLGLLNQLNTTHNRNLESLRKVARQFVPLGTVSMA